MARREHAFRTEIVGKSAYLNIVEIVGRLIDRCRDRLIEFILDKELVIDPGLFNVENSRRYNELQQKKTEKMDKQLLRLFVGFS